VTFEPKLTGDSCGGSRGFFDGAVRLSPNARSRVPYTLHLGGLMLPSWPVVKRRFGMAAPLTGLHNLG